MRQPGKLLVVPSRERLNGALQQQFSEQLATRGHQFTVALPSNSKCTKLHAVRPVPRTDFFDSYIQMSGMVLGSMINADHRLREYEQNMRSQRRWMKERAKWERYEEEISSSKGNGK
jgi:hypothetical protein